MAGGDGDVFHARGLGEGNPRLGVEFLGIEKCSQAIVFVERQLAIMENPFAVAQNAVDAPVDEQAELHVLEFTAGL